MTNAVNILIGANPGLVYATEEKTEYFIMLLLKKKHYQVNNIVLKFNNV